MLKIENLTKSFGGVVATNDVSLHFEPVSLSAIIGPNGAGKTTFFNLITGYDSLTTVRRGIGRAFQVANLFPEFTVREALTVAVLSHRQQTARLTVQFSTVKAHTRAYEIMEMFDLQDRAGVRSKNLSHGDQKLLDIALALALDPRILLLDEPTAGMGPEERWPKAFCTNPSNSPRCGNCRYCSCAKITAGPNFPPSLQFVAEVQDLGKAFKIPSRHRAVKANHGWHGLCNGIPRRAAVARCAPVPLCASVRRNDS